MMEIKKKECIDGDHKNSQIQGHGFIHIVSPPPPIGPPLGLSNLRQRITLFISSYSFSFKQNPSSLGLLIVVIEISRFNPRTTFDRASLSNVFIFPTKDEVQDRMIQQNYMAFGLGLKKSLSFSYNFNLLRDHIKDILSMVLALLFGINFGALKSATLYLAWSLFSNCFYDLRYGFPYFVKNDHHRDNEFSPKKIGYVKILAADSMPTPVFAPASAKQVA